MQDSSHTLQGNLLTWGIDHESLVRLIAITEEIWRDIQVRQNNQTPSQKSSNNALQHLNTLSISGLELSLAKLCFSLVEAFRFENMENSIQLVGGYDKVEYSFLSFEIWSLPASTSSACWPAIELHERIEYSHFIEKASDFASPSSLEVSEVRQWPRMVNSSSAAIRLRRVRASKKILSALVPAQHDLKPSFVMHEPRFK